MTTPVSVLAAGINAGAPATAKVTVNSRVSAAAGPIGVLSDIMQFPGPGAVIGNWVVGATRVQVMGIPAINQASTGTSFGPPPFMPPAGPVTVTLGDPRVSAM